MKNEIIEEKQKIIEHIQQKLNRLRSRRNELQRQKFSQNNNPLSTRHRSINYNKPNKVEKVELQRNLVELQKLYQSKKQLKKIGIVTNDPQQIQKYKNDPKWADFVSRKKQKMQRDAQKQLIINEELKNVQKFLKSKKLQSKQLVKLQQMNYRIMLKERKDQLQTYHRLVMKSSLNRVQKQQLIQLTFQLLKQWNQIIKKEVLKKFLFANPQFCSHFYITHTEINRDLEVLETKTKDCLDQRQFFQFLKSIEVTNPKIRPMIKNQMQKNKQWLKNNQNKKSQNYKQQQKNNVKKQKSKQLTQFQFLRKLIDYTRKIFKNLNRTNQSVVERASFLLSFEKGLYFDQNRQKISLQQIKKVAQFFRQITKEKCSKNYYNQLDAKFINFTQIQLLCKEYCHARKIKQSGVQKLQVENQQGDFEQTSQLQSQQNHQEQSQSEISEQSFQINICSTKQGKQLTGYDIQRYGWNKHIGIQNTEAENKFNSKLNAKVQIGQLDQYYEQVRGKYQNQIQFAQLHNLNQYKQDFKELQAFIKNQEHKHNESHQKCIKNK